MTQEKITSAHLINGVVSMLEVTAAVMMSMISSVLAIHTSRPDTSLEHIMQQKKSMAHSNLNMETTDT